MAVSRSFLKGLGLTDDQISAVIEGHAETTDGLKAQIAEANRRYDQAVEEMNAYKNAGWEQKYNDLNSEFESFKTKQTEQAVRSAKEKAYTAMLREAGISDKRIASVLRVTDIDKIELDDKGNVKDAKAVQDSIKEEWAEFITVRGTKGADVQHPPKNESGNGAVTAEQFKKMGYNERLELYNKDPQAYNELSKE